MALKAIGVLLARKHPTGYPFLQRVLFFSLISFLDVDLHSGRDCRDPEHKDVLQPLPSMASRLRQSLPERRRRLMPTKISNKPGQYNKNWETSDVRWVTLFMTASLCLNNEGF